MTFQLNGTVRIVDLARQALDEALPVGRVVLDRAGRADVSHAGPTVNQVRNRTRYDIVPQSHHCIRKSAFGVGPSTDCVV